MKKLLFLFAAVMTIATIFLFSGCSSGLKRVSERRSGYYTASDGIITVTAVSGVREDPFEPDGVVGEIKPYTLITVVPAVFDVDAVYTYTANIGDYSFGGTLIMHPFAASYSVEVDAEAVNDFTVTVKCGEAVREYEMKSLVTSDMLSYEGAVDCARIELKPSGEYEIRVRLIKNPLSSDGLCWHVIFVSSGGQNSVLIDPITTKTIAKKTE